MEMNSDSKNNLEFIKSKSSKMTALCNGIYLHSPTNPILEAQRFIHSKKSLLLRKKTFLVLGLGLGYHINELYEKAFELYNKNFKIIVIEPNAKLVQRYSTDWENVTILHAIDVKSVYHDKIFVQFLKTSPGILIHQGSFAAQKDFFQEFLKYRNNTDISSILNELTNNDFKEVFQAFDLTANITDALVKIKEKLNNTKYEKIVLAYNCLK